MQSRFLRARKFEIHDAWEQFKETEDWRRDDAIDALYGDVDVDMYESSRRMVSTKHIPFYLFNCL